jgi:hypothetical protein
MDSFALPVRDCIRVPAVCTVSPAHSSSTSNKGEGGGLVFQLKQQTDEKQYGSNFVLRAGNWQPVGMAR